MHKLSTVTLSNGIEMEKKALNALARYLLTVIKSLALIMCMCTLALLTISSIKEIFWIFFAILVYKLEYSGTLNTTSRLDLFRIFIHMFMSICFLPCVYIFEIPLFVALVLHFSSACLESLHNRCVLSVFKYGENINSLHDIIISASVITCLYSVHFNDPFKAIIMPLFNYMVHFGMFKIKQYIDDMFLQMKNFYIARRDFLSKYGKLRTGIYVTVNLLVICSFPIWLHFVTSRIDKGGFYFKLFTSKPYSQHLNIHNEHFHSLTVYCHSSTNPFTLSEMFYDTSNATYLADRNTNLRALDKYNLVVSYFYNEDAYFIHEVNRRQACSNIFFFWKQNGVGINMKYSRKYNFTLTEYDEHIRLLLIIYAVKNVDLGEYILYEKLICSNQVGEKIVSHEIKTEPIVSFCLTRISSKTVKLKGTVGQILTISNFVATISNAEEYFPEYLVGQRDIERVCPLKTYCPTFIYGVHMSNFYSKNVTHITDSLSVVHINVSFCICPDAFTRSDYHSLQLVSKRNRQKVISVIHIELEPTVSELLDRRFADIFETCERYISMPKLFLYSCFAADWEFYFLKRVFEEDLKNFFSRERFLYVLDLLLTLAPLLVFCKLSYIFLFLVFHRNVSRQSFCKLNVEQKAELDVLLSFDEDCYEDNRVALDVITPFITANKYRISSCTVAEHQGNARVVFENLAMKSKTLMIILSSNYLNNDHCKLQYEYTLLPMIGLSKMSKDDVLIIKTESCPPDTHALVTFKVVDWDNSVNRIRSEEEKKEEIISWIKSRTEEPPFLWKFLVTHINTLYRFIKNIITI